MRMQLFLAGGRAIEAPAANQLMTSYNCSEGACDRSMTALVFMDLRKPTVNCGASPSTREESQCRIEPLFPSPQLPSLASHAFRPTPGHELADSTEAGSTVDTTAVVALMAQVMGAVVGVAAVGASAPLPSVPRRSARRALRRITTAGLHADITPTPLAIDRAYIHRSANAIAARRAGVFR